MFNIFHTTDTNAATVRTSHFHTMCWCSFPPWLITNSVPAPKAQPQRSTAKLPASLWKRTDYGHRLLVRRKLNCVAVFLFVNVTSCFLFVSFSEGCTVYFRECDHCVWNSGLAILCRQKYSCFHCTVSKKKSIFFRRVRKICEKRLVTSSCLFFCLTVCSNSALSGRIFIQFDIRVFFFENQSRKFKFH